VAPAPSVSAAFELILRTPDGKSRPVPLAADRVYVPLVDGRVAYFGPTSGMDNSAEPMIRDFIELDEVSFLT